SSRQLKGRDAKEIGAKLEVGAVLQGTVSRSSSRLHVAAEFVRASDDNAMWSETFDGQPSELGGMQDTIVRAITGSLHLARADARTDRTVASARGTNNIDAYNLYLRGRHAADGLEWGKACALYREAIALDSTVSEAGIAKGNALLNEMRFPDAVRAFANAYAKDSTNTDAVWAYGASLLGVGRVDEGVGLLRRARERDPLSAIVVGILGYGLELRRQYDSAIATTRAAVDLGTRNVLAHQGLGFLFAFNNMPDSAVRELERAFALDSTFFGRRSNLVFAYAVAGRWNDALRQRALLERESGGNSPNYFRMITSLAFGEYDAAM